MSRSDEERLNDIRKRCGRLSEIAAQGRQAYDDSWQSRDAASYSLAVIGEALGALSDEFLAQTGELPVRDAQALRNKLIHEYWRIDDDLLWDTIINDIPALESALT